MAVKKRKNHRRRRRFVGIFLLFLILTTAIILAARGCPSSHLTRESVYPDHIGYIPVTTDLLPENCLGRPMIKRKIKWIVIHETANTSVGANAESHNTYIHKKAQNTSLSWHYTVDDHEIYHHVPDNEVAWHAGDSLAKDGGNLNGIGVEICINDDGDFEKAKDNAAQLVAYLLKEYGLHMDNIKQHHDFSGKNCPMVMRDSDTYGDFLKLVENYLQP